MGIGGGVLRGLKGGDEVGWGGMGGMGWERCVLQLSVNCRVQYALVMRSEIHAWLCCALCSVHASSAPFLFFSFFFCRWRAYGYVMLIPERC